MENGICNYAAFICPWEKALKDAQKLELFA